MIVLAMDSTSTNASVAIIDESKVLGEFSVNSKNTHSQTLMPMMDRLLKGCGLTLDDIDVFAVCTGPGSFTGVRIGMATVKTLSQVQNKPIIGISSLDAMAFEFTAEDTLICPVIDARGGNLYNAVYKNGEKIISERVVHIDALLKECEGRKTIFTGDGVLAFGDAFKKDEHHLIAPVHLSMQRATTVAAKALERALKGDFDNTYSLVPLYLRKSQAERELEEKLKKGEKK